MGLLRQYNFPNRFSELKGLRGLKMVNNEIPWSMKLQMLMTFSNSKWHTAFDNKLLLFKMCSHYFFKKCKEHSNYPVIIFWNINYSIMTPEAKYPQPMSKRLNHEITSPEEALKAYILQKKVKTFFSKPFPKSSKTLLYQWLHFLNPDHY